MRNERQSFGIVTELEKKMTIYSHMRDPQKDYSQVKEDVQLNDVQSASQKEFDREFTEIKEGFGKIVRLIQESHEDQLYWMDDEE